MSARDAIGYYSEPSKSGTTPPFSFPPMHILILSSYLSPGIPNGPSVFQTKTPPPPLPVVSVIVSMNVTYPLFSSFFIWLSSFCFARNKEDSGNSVYGGFNDLGSEFDSRCGLRFFSSSQYPYRFWARPKFYLVGVSLLSTKVKRPKREANWLDLSIVGVSNAGVCSSTPSYVILASC